MSVYELPARHRLSSEARVIDGRAVADRIRAQLANEVAAFSKRTGRRPGLATVLVGDDPASAVYVDGKQRAARQMGIEPFDHRLPAGVSAADLEELVCRLNADPRVDGVLCQLPLPAGLDGVAVTELVDPAKDVDGLTTINAGALFTGRPGLVPCTPAGVMLLLQEAGVETAGRHAVVVGRSDLFGKPMAQMLLAADATVTVTLPTSRAYAEPRTSSS
jgi:methylenetetrahydrofolate dehydrogenase (NADP+)/methenyltetrahydrofolate cyclohydrolase